jgi:hypothetical protein
MTKPMTIAIAAVALVAMTAPATAAQINVNASAGNNVGEGPFLYGPYTKQHRILNTLPIAGITPGNLTTVINGVTVSGPGSPATSFSVAVSEPRSSASAYADMRLGKIGAFAGTTPTGFSSSSASISDRLMFNIPGAAAATITPLRFRISLHATALDAYGNMTFSGYTWLGTLGGGYASNVQPWVIGHNSWLEGTTRYFDLTYNLVGSNPAFGADLILEAIANSGSTSDFSNTASIQIFTPPGAIFTSESGQFLAGANAVPEPGSWAMLITGFGLVGAIARRSRTRHGIA